ncbi:uncharacterized protein A4U43_C07F20500 [Asparagus officinalis]|uniref:Uncharacterized protein n=1 Tax=Asparagus officinalis TaxID=4686 RepID=A0A5P1EDL4_ASPOF|nr:uncharacterized protein A4U43_C07F20500 [Asparagus officinalis]
MGVRRKTLILGFSIALFLGVAVYFRLWSMDSRDASFTADDREVLRRQFERANMEAMDESAGWRMKFDGEYERSKRLQEELSKNIVRENEIFLEMVVVAALSLPSSSSTPRSNSLFRAKPRPRLAQATIVEAQPSPPAGDGGGANGVPQAEPLVAIKIFLRDRAEDL